MISTVGVLSFCACPPLDALVVPGGRGTRAEATHPALLDFIAAQAAQARAMPSVCTGASLLHAGELLEDRRATTHRGSLARLGALGDVTVVDERVVREGSVWSSAGLRAS